MKYITPVIFFLIVCNQKAFSRHTLDYNAIAYPESRFFKSYWTSNGDGPRQIAYHHNDDYDHRVIFPDTTNWSEPTRTSQWKIRQCITTCQSYSEYQPVCGTDSVTYHNQEQLRCYMNCGVEVKLRYLSKCQGWEGTTASPIVPSTSNSASDNLEPCMKSCPFTSEYNPVCGSDGVTYSNPGKLSCAQYCGKDIQLKRRSRCSTIRPTEPATTTTSPRRIDEAVQACMVSCFGTPDYRPVCGTNNETYFNISKLQCAIDCGVDVSLSKSVACHIQVKSDTNEEDSSDEGIDIRFKEIQ